MMVSDCVGERVATVPVLSLPPAVEFAVTGHNKSLELLDLCAV